MSGDHLPAKPTPSGLVFDPHSASPMVRRGLDRLNMLIAVRDDGPRLLWSFVAYGRHRTYEREPPTALPVLAENIPEELKQLRQWVCWDFAMRWDRGRAEWRWSKPPIDPTHGGSADEHVPGTWAEFDDALAFAEGHGLSGIGFVLTESDPYAGVDIDNCRSPIHGGLTNLALTTIKDLSSYTEWSPTGSGVHIIVRGVLPPRSSDERFTNPELFDRSQFLSFTGHVFSSSRNVVRDRQEELTAVQLNQTPTTSVPFLVGSQHSLSLVGRSSDIVGVRCWDGHHRFLDRATGAERWYWG